MMFTDDDDAVPLLWFDGLFSAALGGRCASADTGCEGLVFGISNQHPSQRELHISRHRRQARYLRLQNIYFDMTSRNFT